jgi:hypothetical protein
VSSSSTPCTGGAAVCSRSVIQRGHFGLEFATAAHALAPQLSNERHGRALCPRLVVIALLGAYTGITFGLPVHDWSHTTPQVLGRSHCVSRAFPSWNRFHVD